MIKTEKQLLEEAIQTIQSLREENAILKARLEMFDSLMLLFNTKPAYSGLCTTEVDVIYKLKQAINIESEEVLKDQLKPSYSGASGTDVLPDYFGTK